MLARLSAINIRYYIICFFFLYLSSEKPVLEKPTTTIAALYVEQKELTCSVKAGNPAPTVTWQHQIDTCESSSTDKCEPLDNAWSDVDEVCVCLFIS